MQYTVIVGNVGVVHDSTNGLDALASFCTYRILSATGTGKALKEPVTLMGDGKIIKEHLPKEVKS